MFEVKSNIINLILEEKSIKVEFDNDAIMLNYFLTISNYITVQ